MENYKELYFQLFGQVADVIERLQKIQQDAEDRFIEADLGEE